MRYLATLAGALTVLVAAPAFAQSPATRQAQLPENTRPPDRNAEAPGTTRMAVKDALFAAAAGEASAVQSSLGQLGKERATDPALQRFSAMMLEEHPRLSGELTSLASIQGITLPERVDYRGRFCVESLAGLSGREFDACYAKAQLVAHMEIASLFEAEVKRGADPRMNALASNALPRVKQHLQMIKAIAARYMNQEESPNAR